jgi:phosphate transport system substrate-binding protein
VRRALLALCFPVMAACDGDAPPPPPSTQVLDVVPDVAALHVMGTGAMTPLASKLAAAWSARAGVPRVVVEPSVGTTGGVRAAVDGAIDLGTISRPLRDDEAARGLIVVPVAKSAVVVAAGAESPTREITSTELVSLVRGDVTHLRDGTPVSVLLRDRDESANAALDRMIPALRAAREHAYATDRWRIIYHDAAMGEALAASPGAIGPFDLGAIVAWKLPLVPLAVDGVTPSPSTVESGAWRATRDLSLVFRPDRAARVAAFVAFVTSDEGRRIARENGYVPVGIPR